VAVRSLRQAASGFDPRRDARWRVYRYRVRPGGAHRPLDRHRTLEIDDDLDVAAMRAAAARLVGERDFGALGSHRHGRTVRRLAQVAVSRRGGVIEMRVTADAFLRRMVRSIVAVLLEVGRGRIAPEAIDGLLEGGRRALHGRAAPARGLTLERVIYNTKKKRSGTDAAGGIGPSKTEAESRRR
jgi:tRNA pseudouridine38-40 synthase